jgi:signal peptidase I
MSKHRQNERKRQLNTAAAKSAASPAATPDAEGVSGWFSAASIRETVESIIVAFVLAFLFRTFEAEAFVIPTGSMAPTLFGRHKDIVCPECGYDYQVSSSSEVDPNSGDLKKVEVRPGESRNVDVIEGTCPMCRYTASIGKDISYNGDRLLVGKFIYQFQEPERWDVVVFKFPGGAMNNYIKRLVGLPGETIRISHGNLWVRQGNGPFNIARKRSPQKLQATLIPVFDNDYMPRIAAGGWPQRWQAAEAGGGWKALGDGSFEVTAHAPLWLRYQHLVPNLQQWMGVTRTGMVLRGDQPVPRLIDDYLGYNTGWSGDFTDRPRDFGLHWVGDLAVKCQCDVQSDGGEARWDLVKGGRHFQCRVDLVTGTATLTATGSGMEKFRPQAATPLHGRGRHEVLFCNVDDQLRLLVDGREMTFDQPTTYDSRQIDTHHPTEADLQPVGVAASDATLHISHLQVLRNLYYIAQPYIPQSHAITDYKMHTPDLADPSTWDAFNDANMSEVDFPLAPPDAKNPGKDQFLVLGDNSPQSADSRLWDSAVLGPDLRPVERLDGKLVREYWVNRELLIGKALFIYWPHSFDRIPGTRIPCPFFPNVGRMHLVR